MRFSPLVFFSSNHNSQAYFMFSQNLESSCCTAAHLLCTVPRQQGNCYWRERRYNVPYIQPDPQPQLGALAGFQSSSCLSCFYLPRSLEV